MNNQQWVRYSTHRHNAAALAILSLLWVGWWLVKAATLVDFALFVGGYAILLNFANREWNEAKLVRKMARADDLVASALATIVAATILGALSELAAEGGDSDV